MRPIVTAIACTGLVVGAALAQTTTPGTASPQMQTPPMTSPMPGNPTMPPAPPTMPPAPATGATATGSAMSNDTMPARPSDWKGSDADWQAHVRNCRTRNGYDAATDKYRTSSGQMRTCPR